METWWTVHMKVQFEIQTVTGYRVCVPKCCNYMETCRRLKNEKLPKNKQYQYQKKSASYTQSTLWALVCFSPYLVIHPVTGLLWQFCWRFWEETVCLLCSWRKTLSKCKLHSWTVAKAKNMHLNLQVFLVHVYSGCCTTKNQSSHISLLAFVLLIPVSNLFVSQSFSFATNSEAFCPLEHLHENERPSKHLQIWKMEELNWQFSGWECQKWNKQRE